MPTKSARNKESAKGAKQPATADGSAESASTLIDGRIEQLGDWRGEQLQRLRQVIRRADRRIVEQWKWQTPVWFCSGIICTGEIYKDKVKLTFARGASLKDPSGLFNSSLDGKVRRAIDTRQGERLDEAALADLVRAAVAVNLKSKGPVEHEEA